MKVVVDEKRSRKLMSRYHACILLFNCLELFACKKAERMPCVFHYLT